MKRLFFIISLARVKNLFRVLVESEPAYSPNQKKKKMFLPSRLISKVILPLRGGVCVCEVIYTLSPSFVRAEDFILQNRNRQQMADPSNVSSQCAKVRNKKKKRKKRGFVREERN